MTKVIIIGEVEKPKLKPIEFCKAIMSNGFDEHALSKPQDFDYIELISLDYDKGFDLMFAYDDFDERERGVAYLGHFNDGVVE